MHGRRSSAVRLLLCAIRVLSRAHCATLWIPLPSSSAGHAACSVLNPQLTPRLSLSPCDAFVQDMRVTPRLEAEAEEAEAGARASHAQTFRGEAEAVARGAKAGRGGAAHSSVRDARPSQFAFGNHPHGSPTCRRERHSRAGCQGSEGAQGERTQTRELGCGPGKAYAALSHAAALPPSPALRATRPAERYQPLVSI